MKKINLTAQAKSRWSRWNSIAKIVSIVGLPLALLLLWFTFKTSNTPWQGILSNASVSVLTVVATVVLVDGLYQKKEKEARAPSERFVIRNMQLILHRNVGSIYMEFVPAGSKSMVEILKKRILSPDTPSVKSVTDSPEIAAPVIKELRENIADLLVQYVSAKSYAASREQAIAALERTIGTLSEIDELLELRRWALSDSVHNEVVEIRERINCALSGLAGALNQTETRSDEKDSKIYVQGILAGLAKSLVDCYHSSVEIKQS